MAWVSKNDAVSDCQSFINKLVYFLTEKWQNFNNVRDVKIMKHGLTVALLQRIQPLLIKIYDSLQDNRQVHERVSHPLLQNITLEDLDVQVCSMAIITFNRHDRNF